MTTPNARDDFFFDLRGYLIIENAVEPELLDELNVVFDHFPRDLEVGAWYRGAQRRDYHHLAGLELHHCIEIGEPFEKLIDNPSWINHVRRYCGEQNSYVEGLLIDECIASIRNSGGFFPVHSGGYQGVLRGRYLYEHNLFRCGQINILMALSDIGPGDGATMVIPGSHKSNFPYPEIDYGSRMDETEGAIQVHLNKGDALLFVDGLMHGGSSRTNPGERRVVIYRYGPAWATTRFGYQYSQQLLDRLTPQRRKILQPIRPCPAGSDFIPSEIGFTNEAIATPDPKDDTAS